MPSAATATLSPQQVATELGVNEKTVRNWIKAGVVEASRTPAGRYRLAPSVIPALKKLGQEIPLNTRELRRRQAREDRPPT
jgi:excisionase family DNA binding protein